VLDAIARTHARLSIAVSLDGPPEVHDAIRRTPGSYARALETLQRLRVLATRHPQRLARLLVITTISRYNAPHLADWLPGVLAATGAEIRLNLVRSSRWHTFGADPAGLSADMPGEDCRLPASELATWCATVTAAIEETTPPSLSTAAALEVLQRNVEILSGRTPRRKGCRAGQQSLVLYPNGDAAWCEMLRPIGNIAVRGYDVPAFWHSVGARSAAAAKSCACTHECRWFTSMPYDGRLLAGVLKRNRRGLLAASARGIRDPRESRRRV
jgi:sulfatase maturation enzyme AslB (radical SAM superfamily)